MKESLKVLCKIWLFLIGIGASVVWLILTVNCCGGRGTDINWVLLGISTGILAGGWLIAITMHAVLAGIAEILETGAKSEQLVDSEDRIKKSFKTDKKEASRPITPVSAGVIEQSSKNPAVRGKLVFKFREPVIVSPAKPATIRVYLNSEYIGTIPAGEKGIIVADTVSGPQELNLQIAGGKMLESSSVTFDADFSVDHEIGIAVNYTLDEDGIHIGK